LAKLIEEAREGGSGVPIGAAFGELELADGWLNFKRLSRLEVLLSTLDEPPLAGGIRGWGVSAGLMMAELW